MDQARCVFCQSPLDGSDEHIIPQSINGRLHSKDIICHNCNSNIFGQKIDPVAKQLFNPLILFLGWDNASGLKAEDDEGGEYVFNKKMEPRPLRPLKKIITKGSAQILHVKGDIKNTLNFFRKEAERLKGEGKILKGFKVSKSIETPTLKAKWELKANDELFLLLNKISIEFCAFNKIDLTPLEQLTKKVRFLEKNIKNVTLCNQRNEVRDFSENEVSHLLVLRSDKESQRLYCYIELFNLVCAVVVLADGYIGEDVDFVYHQDAITGERFGDPIQLKMTMPEIFAHNFKEDNFEYLNNYLSERLRGRELSKVIDSQLPKILESVKLRVENGEIESSQQEITYINESTEFIAHLTVYEFPYILSDQADEENDDYNWIHSNFRENIVDQFINDNSDMIGKKVKIETETFIIEGFKKEPRIVKIDKKLITLYVTLISEETEAKRYIKIKDFVEGLYAAKAKQQEE